MGGGYETNVFQASASASQCQNGGSSGGSGPSPTPPAPTPTPPAPSGPCTDGWSGCATQMASMCGQDYTMTGSTQKLDDFCCATCKGGASSGDSSPTPPAPTPTPPARTTRRRR